MKRIIKLCFVLMLSITLFMENASVPEAAVSVKQMKTLYLRMYDKKIDELIAASPDRYLMGEDHFSYAYLSVPNAKYPLFLMMDQYNYSICKIYLYKYSGEANNQVMVSNINKFSGQTIYHYKKYLFVEEFAGGGCGRIVMYKYSNGKFREIKNGAKSFSYSSYDEVHSAAIKYAKKLAKKKGLKFSKFKEIKWK